jgi:plasmid stability protein
MGPPLLALGCPVALPVRSIYMCSTCKYAERMQRMIQVRNVPDAIHRTLKARAAMAGMSLSDYLLGELREIADRPTLAEFRVRLHSRVPLSASFDTAEILQEERVGR